MKTILLPIEPRLEPRAPLDSALATAALLARAFGSYVEGFAVAPELPVIVPADAFSGAMVTADPALMQNEAESSACRSAFGQGLTALGLRPQHGEAGSAPSFGWYDGTGPGGSAQGRAFLGSYGRVFDIAVLCRPETSSDAVRMALLETALFESGRPVLIAPPQAPKTLGENILIAWNGTPEVARTVAFARPLLERAKAVQVVTIAGGQTEAPGGEDLARHLRRNGIACEVHEAAETEARGAAFLSEAARLGCDLVVKGAYTQSRLRQMIFGGATRHIVTEATVPVFMAH